MTFRSYHNVGGDDASAMAAQVAGLRSAVELRLRPIRNIVAVASGKGGVGKSFVTALLGRALAKRGRTVGILDADLKSPTVGTLLGVNGKIRVSETSIEPSRDNAGIRVVSTSLILDEGQPLKWNADGGDAFIWRGTREAEALRQMLAETNWGSLDFLFIDLPPGDDRVADLFDLLPRGCVVAVTIPSPESQASVARSLRAAIDRGLRVAGIIENMSGQECPDCGAVVELFSGRAGAALAEAFDTRLLARLPFVRSGLEGALDRADPLVDALMETVE